MNEQYEITSRETCLSTVMDAMAGAQIKTEFPTPQTVRQTINCDAKTKYNLLESASSAMTTLSIGVAEIGNFMMFEPGEMDTKSINRLGFFLLEIGHLINNVENYRSMVEDSEPLFEEQESNIKIPKS